MDQPTKPKLKPTSPSGVMRKKRALKIWEKNGFKNLNKALTQVGYSDSAVRAGRITASKTWKELVEEFLPDDLLAKRHMELLNKREYKLVPQYEQDPDDHKKSIKTYKKIDLGPDTAAIAKGLDLAYKVKGSYKESQEPPAKGNTYNLFFDPKVKEARRLYEDTIKQQIKHASIKRIKAIPSQTEGSDTPTDAPDNPLNSGEGNQGAPGDVGEIGSQE